MPLYGFCLAMVAVTIAETVDSREDVSPLMIVSVLDCAPATAGERRLMRRIDRRENRHRRWHARGFQGGRLR